MKKMIKILVLMVMVTGIFLVISTGARRAPEPILSGDASSNVTMVRNDSPSASPRGRVRDNGGTRVHEERSARHHVPRINQDMRDKVRDIYDRLHGR